MCGLSVLCGYAAFGLRKANFGPRVSLWEAVALFLIASPPSSTVRGEYVESGFG